jgi:hypothetical protein
MRQDSGTISRLHKRARRPNHGCCLVTEPAQFPPDGQTDGLAPPTTLGDQRNADAAYGAARAINAVAYWELTLTILER